MAVLRVESPAGDHPQYRRRGSCALAHAADVVVMDLWLGSDQAMIGTSSTQLLSYYLGSGKPVLAISARHDHGRLLKLFVQDELVLFDWPPERRELTETVRAAFTDEHVNAIDQSTALKRRVEHDELGRLAVFLASDLARCITGQFILADAGAFLSRTRPPNLRHEETRLGDRPDHTSQPARPGPERPPAERNHSRGAS